MLEIDTLRGFASSAALLNIKSSKGGCLPRGFRMERLPTIPVDEFRHCKTREGLKATTPLAVVNAGQNKTLL